MSDRGLWLTKDEGATWQKLGGDEIKNRPGKIVFDPQNSDVFWVSGCYGDAPIKTDDGGKNFRSLGRLSHADGVAVDLPDPQRKTLLLGLHEQLQSLHMSTDGGATWTNFGPPTLFKPNGITYSEKGKCFYGWHLSDNTKLDPPSNFRLGVK